MCRREDCTREEGNYQLQQLRGGDGERILQQSSPCPAPAHERAWCLSTSTTQLHVHAHCPPGSPEISSGLAETSSLLRLTATTIPTEVARASRGLSSVITILHHGVLISPVWPTEGNRLVQCALTETNRHLPASMASNTHRRVFRKRARQSSPPYTILPGQEPILPWRPSRPASLLQRWPSSRRPSR